MLVEVKVPALSESVAEATLISWHKKAGDYVNRSENLIDIETDKVVMELPAPSAGVLAKVLKGDGATVASGEVIAMIETEATVQPENEVKPAPAASQQAQAPAAVSAEKSSIDSSLILLNSNTFLLAAAKEPRLLEAVRPVSLISLSPMALISNKPWSSIVAESTSLKSITVGISTPGSTSHLCALQVAEAIGVKPNLVVYKGAAPLLSDLIAKSIEYACLEMSASVPMFVSQGKISAVAISADEAIATLPNVPTFESLGIKNITKGQWSILASLEKSSVKFNVDSANAIRIALQGKLNIPNGLFNFVPVEAVSNENAVNFVQ
ncbi:MAG: hypothetical protein EBU46_18570, partial [Nitrosomonadaceae bacterium]|nr:hypothetical protein [Nitrosomonadaceae bacterium]